LLKHELLAISARLRDPIRDVAVMKEWMLELIDAIDMELLMGPEAIYYSGFGLYNVGMTAFAIITTSHIGLHTFENYDSEGKYVDTKLELDIYTCKSFDPKSAFKMIEQFGPLEISYKFMDRENDFAIIERP